MCVYGWVNFVCAGESDLCAQVSQICVRRWARSVCVAESGLCAPLSQICVRRWVPYHKRVKNLGFFWQVFKAEVDKMCTRQLQALDFT